MMPWGWFISILQRMTNYKLAVFDMAGTTVRDNNEVEHCFAKSLKIAGINISEARIKALQGWSKRTVFELLWKEKLGNTHTDITKKVDENYAIFKEILENHYQDNPALPQPFAQETFDLLRNSGISIALTTGFYREITDIILGQLNWNPTQGTTIDLSLCSDDVKNGRPAPDMIKLAMNNFGITDAKQVIKVGDTPSDLLAGNNAQVGLNLAVLNGTHTANLLESHPHDALIPNLRGLHKYLISNPVV